MGLYKLICVMVLAEDMVFSKSPLNIWCCHHHHHRHHLTVPPHDNYTYFFLTLNDELAALLGILTALTLLFMRNLR